MKKIMKRLLCELLKDSKRSDRELAKVLGVSQATVSRMRNRLVKDKWIKEFTIIPDFAKMGYEIMAISFAQKKKTIIKTSEKGTNELSEKAAELIKRYPNIIFAARAEGIGKSGLMISLHKDYTDYSNFSHEQMKYWEDEIADYETILISLKGTIVRQPSMRYLAEHYINKMVECDCFH